MFQRVVRGERSESRWDVNWCQIREAGVRGGTHLVLVGQQRENAEDHRPHARFRLLRRAQIRQLGDELLGRDLFCDARGIVRTETVAEKEHARLNRKSADRKSVV